jgi:adenylate cyclase
VHASVARAIEVVSSARLDENAALLAHHWEEADEAREAARWHRRAAEWAGLNSGEALHHWKRVRDLLDAVPQEEETLSHGAAARAQTLWHQIRIGISEEEAAALFKEGHDLASRSENRPALALILNSYGLFRLYSGGVREAQEFAESAVREADRTGDPGLRIALRWTLVSVHFSAGHLDDCLKVIDEALLLGEHDLDLGADIQGYSPYLFMLALRGYAWAGKACLEQGARDLDRAMELARAHGKAFNVASTHLLYVSFCDVSGDDAGALAHARRAAELTGQMGNPVVSIWSSQALGHAYALNERWEEAAGALEPALELARTRRTFLQMEPDFLVTLARVSLESGKEQEARVRAEEAVQLADEYGTNLFEVRALLMLSRVLLRIGGGKTAEEVNAALARAQTLIEETGGAAYAPWVHERRADLARLLGNDEECRRELREAQRLFTAMGAKGHAERLARELEP